MKSSKRSKRSNSQIAIGEAEKQLEDGRAILDKTKKSVADETDSIKSEIARLEAELKETESSLPEDFKAEYMRVSRVRGEEALAAVEDDCCTGCYQRVTPNMISRLMMDPAFRRGAYEATTAEGLYEHFKAAETEGVA